MQEKAASLLLNSKTDLGLLRDLNRVFKHRSVLFLSFNSKPAKLESSVAKQENFIVNEKAMFKYE